MAETKAAKKPTTYEIFLRDPEEGSWAHVTTVDAGSAQAALKVLTDLADKTDTDASGEYMVAPKSNITYLRPTKKITSTYEMEQLDLMPAPESLAVDEAEHPEPVEEAQA
jgi:1,2-phenylacetyl-CoA epoxidase PaaB subunit